MILALISRKGGVGKTTTAVNLAAAMAERKRRVLLIDLDPQASASIAVGLQRSELSPSMADVLCGETGITEVLRRTEWGFDLAPSGVDLSDLEHSIGRLRRPERRLQERLADARPLYDHILIDCPTGLGLTTLCALVAADAYLAVTPPRFLCWEGLPNLRFSVDRAVQRAGCRVDFLGVVPTRVGKRDLEENGSLASLKEEFGDLLLPLVRRDRALAEAPAHGKPVLAYDPDSIGSQDYRALASQLLEDASEARGGVAVSPREGVVERLDGLSWTSPLRHSSN